MWIEKYNFFPSLFIYFQSYSITVLHLKLPYEGQEPFLPVGVHLAA